ncbi:Metallo-dependent phosphatase-like protein [Nemania sp. FL0916]|nr:Metallo-dependent phosphatase-like protein [Nemania sp. FL0916]
MADTTASSSPRRTRRTRFVCISDTHNCTVRLPKGDVLIHCGDLTNQGSFGELSKQVQWLEAADFECKIIVAGNHDLTLDADFMTKYGAYRFNTALQPAEDCRALLTESKSLTYLRHESRTIKLNSPSGPQTTFSVFGSPYSPVWGGAWAFQYARPEDDDNKAARLLWDDIPLDTDILITHGPARTHCDYSLSRETAGCEIIRQKLWQVRPRLALCGHIHEARGAERVRWSLDSNVAQYAELGRTAWQDPNPDSDKNALIDLTAKGGNPLDNDGSPCLSYEELCKIKSALATSDQEEDRDMNSMDIDEDLGSAHSSLAALASRAGRLGRKETCVVNCAIQHVSYPHAGRGPRRLNKPIVVDLDLPIWADQE